ncbi:SGF29 tudor-like domain-containing protein [Truncatella angustata]|uniref:SGF29 tudor-like domain-containing protein n=1 Tax=Truncatella angustata TaxID=152316 RepID=A0A9P8UPR7_9PEZI|nr:SGF29 tudor-like domain-containing protein [Truncatella angustata]KAH6656103.1 SGF29 tudor-like domain-containing protein [Truncatella angustata]
MSQRNRGQRSANRNSEGGEEYFLWQSIQSSISSLVPSINESSQNVQDIADQDKQMVSKQAAGDFDKRDLKGNRSDLKAAYEKIDSLFRAGVKVNEKTSAQLKEVIEKLHVLSALQKAKEESQEPSLSRSATQRAKESAAASSSVYDFDGSGDSPVPSPNPSVARRMGGSTGSKGDRGSVPPSVDRSTPVAKAGSAEPQGPGAALARSKVIFSKGEEVAFKPKPQNSEPTDWILGVVQDVRGEGKSRRYRVLDADVDDTGKQKEFRSSASSMIGIPKEGTVLPGLDPGKTVLALYPNTTTLYKAEVHGMADDGKVNLKFEGEESSNTVQAVARRYVVEYRA